MKFSFFRQKRFVNQADERPPGNYLSVPPDCTLFHLTHWKAGSQWMREIFNDAFGPNVIPQEPFSRQLLARPVEIGKAYSCVYLARHEFCTLTLPRNQRRVVLIRDLRDTLVSGYFSMRYSHGLNDRIEKWRRVMNKLPEEEGILYMLEVWLNGSALVQRSWLEAGEQCVKLEDFMDDPTGQMDKMLRHHFKLEVDRQWVNKLMERHSFARYSGGRKPGQEDAKSHYRKGVKNDWRNHFTPRITDRFKQLYGDILIAGGYEKDDSW